MENTLWKLGEKLLKPSEEDIMKANASIADLSRALQTKSKFKIDRIITAGSYGKATPLAQHFDIDLVVFVNDKEPPFKNVLKDFEDILDLDERLKISDVHTTCHSLQFRLNGIEFDLLPATNFIKSLTDRGNAIERQRDLALARIQSEFDKTGKYDSSYSSALAESQVEFLKNQSAFVHSLVRLCKFWLKTLDIGYIYGQGLIIELIAVSAGKGMESAGERSMTQGFIKCLEMIIGFNSIRINFKPDGRTPSKILNCAGAVIMDTTNPYNNVACGVNPQAVNKLIGFARETKRRITNFQMFPLLELIFAPQPTEPQMISVRPVPIVEIRGKVNYSHPNMIVHERSKFMGNELEELKIRIQQTVVTQVQALLANEKPGTSSFDVQKLVMKTVEKHVQGQTNMAWTFPKEKHEDYDVTFVIPFQTGEGQLSCWVSFKKP